VIDAVVGAFVVGLVLEGLHYRDLTDRREHTLTALVEPIAGALPPH
jgi:Kef-type K+ transport system membrane component KefB